MTQGDARLSRRAALIGVAAVAGLAAAPKALAAPSILTGAGDVRVIKLSNPHTGDSLNTVYWVEGQYIPEVMAEIDFLMRDWRCDTVKPIAHEVLDIAAAVHRKLDTSEPFSVFSGYRTPQTNAMLRSRSRAVASNSYHMKAMAADLHLKSRSVGQMARAAVAVGKGGVGRYTRSDFVHMDCGPVRTWGR